MSVNLNTPEGVLAVYVDMIDVTSMGLRPDHSWTYTDEQGHEHYYEGYPVPYPTLVDVTDATYYCADCHDDHEDSHLECRICGEVITPGVGGGSSYREYIPGRRHFTLDGAEISEERFTELMSRYRGE